MRASSLINLLWLGTTCVYGAPTFHSAIDSNVFAIQWGACPEDSPKGLDCGQLEVPLDWNAPDEKKISLCIARINATDTSERLDSLLFNPGGPGGAATVYCGLQASGIPIFSESLPQHFDIICPDPRGVGSSTPVLCDPEIWSQNVSLYPKNEHEFQALVDWNKAKGCLKDVNTAAAGTCRHTVTGDDIRLNVQAQLILKNDVFGGLARGWEALGLALNQSVTADNATLLSSGTLTSNSSSNFAAFSILCLDWGTGISASDLTNIPKAFSQLQEKKYMGDAFNKHVGCAAQMWSLQSSCLGWPIDIVNPPHVLDQSEMQKTSPILMVNALHDPSTSYTWAVSVRDQIPNAVLMTREGDGHTSYFLEGEARKVMDAYLVNGTVPAEGLVIQS